MSKPVVVNFIGDATKLNRTIGQTQKKMGGLKSAIVGLGLGAAIAAGFKELPGISRHIEELDTKAKAVFENQLPKVKAWAEANKNAFGLTSRETIGLAANFADLLKPMGFTAAEATTMSTKVVGLSGALAKWSGGQFTAAEVSSKLSKAMLGEREELKSLGISISENDVQQRLAKKGQENLTGAALQQAKAVATQELIFEKSTDAQKAWTNGGRQAAEAQNKMKVTMQEAKEALAVALTPAIKTATGAISKMVDWVGKNQGKAKLLAAAIVAVTGFIIAMSVATKVTTAIQTAARGATVAWSAAQWLLNAALTANPIGLVIAAVALLVAGIIIAYKKSETFRRIVATVWDAVKNKIADVVLFIIKILRGWLNFQFAVVEGILHVMGKLPGPMGAPFRKAEEAVKKAKQTVNTELDKIQNRVNDLKGKNIPITASLGLKFSPSVTKQDWVQIRLAAGRMRLGGKLAGYGGGDILPILAEPGETVVDKERTRKFADVFRAMGVKGFQGGGPVGNIGTTTRAVNKVEAWGTARRMGKGVNSIMNQFGMFGDPSGGGGSASLYRLVGYARQAMMYWHRLFPNMTIGGWRARGSVPGSDHPKGKALDLMTTSAAMHRLIIALGKGLPGAKYWISMRRIGQASAGWASHAYHGPSPHTDHVHWSYYHRGGRLSEDVFGMGRSGRGYAFQAGEGITPRGSGGVNVNFYGDVYGNKHEITKAVRAGLKEALRSEGKRELAAQL